MNLENLRSELSSIDRQLIELIAERQRIVGEIGRSKQSAGRATRDYEREKEVLEMARRQARSLNVDPKIAEEILSTLIRSSLTHQERDRVVAEAVDDRTGCGLSRTQSEDDPQPQVPVTRSPQLGREGCFRSAGHRPHARSFRRAPELMD